MHEATKTRNLLQPILAEWRCVNLMPAFVTNGPDIPEHLLQAHEDGHVVFFCGAGISAPAGLPLFKGLVDGIYKQLGTNKEPVEKEAYEKGHYDATIHQLERRYPGQRPAVRRTLASVLNPELDGEGATDYALGVTATRKRPIRHKPARHDQFRPNFPTCNCPRRA